MWSIYRNTSNIGGISRRFRSRGPLKKQISHKTESRRHIQRSATAGHQISVSSILLNPSLSSSVLPGRVVRREQQMFRSLPHFRIVGITPAATLQPFAIASRKHKNINKLQLVSSDGTTNRRPLASFLLHKGPAQQKPTKSVLKQPSADLHHHWMVRPIRLRLLRPATNIVFPSDNRIPSGLASGADKAVAGLSTATFRRSGQIHRIHIPHAITGTATTINPESESVNETLSASSITIPLDVIGFGKSSIHKVSAESLKARPMTTSSKKTTTVTTTASTITTTAPNSTLASTVLPSFSNIRRLIIINRSFTLRNGNGNDSLSHLPSQSSANLKQISITTTDIPEKDSTPNKLFFSTTHRQVNVTSKLADKSTSEIISKASTTLPIANTELKIPIQSSLDGHATGERETPIEESKSEILCGRATSESFAKLLGKDSGNLLGTLKVPNEVDKSISMEMPIPLVEKEFVIKQTFGKGTKDNELRESFPAKPKEVFSTITTSTITTSTTTSSTTSSPTATAVIENTTSTATLSPTSSPVATTVTIGSNSTTSLTITTSDLFTKEVVLSQSSTLSSVVPFEPNLPPEDLKIVSQLKENLDENFVNGVLSTPTPPPSTLKTLSSSVQQIGAPGAEPPNDSVVDELNRAENFMECNELQSQNNASHQ